VGYHTAIPGGTVTLSLSIIDLNTPANNPVIGEAPTVAVRRTSDDKWWDFVGEVWDTIATYALLDASNKQALTDKDDGTYEHDWDQATTDASAERTYIMVYEVAAGTYQSMDMEVWEFVSQLADIADAVWDEALTGATHNVATSAGRRLRQLEIGEFTTWYVDGVSGDDGNDGDTPDAPFKTIGAALTAAGAGERIVVGPTTYAEAALEMDVANVSMYLDRGAIITGGGTGTCLVISAASCEVEGGLLLPGAAEIGIDIEATADYARVTRVRTYGCSVGFDVNASMCALVLCRSVAHSVTGFDIVGDYCRFTDCKANGGGSAVRGFYLSANSADNNHLCGCESGGNTTAGFAVVAGANNNCFAFCASGGADGAVADAGTNNSWAGYATLPAAAADEYDTVIARILGLVQENFYMDTVVEDASSRMTSARMRLYSAAGSVGTAANVIATYTITVTYTGDSEIPTSYKVVAA